MRNRARNEPLRALVKEAGWTNHNFALAVNRVAAEAGMSLHYDRTSVSHWLSGSRPRPPVPSFAAEALTRRIGRLVSVADTGMGYPEDSRIGCPGEGYSCVTALHELVAADLDPVRQVPLRAQPFRVDWATVPDFRGTREAAGPPCGTTDPVETEDLSAISAMISAFTIADESFGGGHARLALAAYLEADVMARLRSGLESATVSGSESGTVSGIQSGTVSGIESGPAGRRDRELLRAAVALTYLIGFMSFDELHHNLAQRYYRVALCLAEEAGDVIGHAVVLRGMSVQAWFLGHHRQALRLADAAVERAGSSAPPGTRAVLLGQAAVAHAALTNRTAALTRLAEAERYLDSGDDSGRPTKRTDRADVAHQAGQALAFLHEHSQAEAALSDSLRYRTEAERRSRMLTLYHLAEAQLRQGRVEQACATWQRFLDEYPRIHSARVGSALRAFRGQLRPHSDNAAVRRALDRAAALAL